MAVKQKWWPMEESITELFQDGEKAHQQRQDTIPTQKQVTQLWALPPNQDLPWSSVWQSAPLNGMAPLHGRPGAVRTNHRCCFQWHTRRENEITSLRRIQLSETTSRGGKYQTPGATDTTDYSNCRCLQTGNSSRGQDAQSTGVCNEVERNHVSKYDKFKTFNNHLLCTYREGIVTCASFNPDYNQL